MAATTTVFSDLLRQLQTDWPLLTFAPGDISRWSSETATVHYNAQEDHSAVTLLHETAHGLLGHTSYDYDIDLIKLERAAWHKATELGKHYGVDIDDNTIELALDSYRDWLHARSTCPTCGRNGAQTNEHQYTCLVCEAHWHVNDARNCGLKRRKLTHA